MSTTTAPARAGHEATVVAGRTTPPEGSEPEQVERLETEIEQLRTALQSQRTIGVALGLLAQRYACTTEAAWALLTRISSHTNTKVREVARVLVEAFEGCTQDGDAALLRDVRRLLPADVGSRDRGASA